MRLLPSMNRKTTSIMRLFLFLLLLAGFYLPGKQIAASEFPAALPVPASVETTDRLIVRMRPGQLQTDAVHAHLSRLAGLALTPHRVMGDQAQVYRLPGRLPVKEVAGIAQRLNRDPGVLYAVPDRLAHATAFTPPNDPLYSQQWDLFEPAAGIDAPAAWSITTGASNIIVADLDSGARFEHEDLRGRLIAGYDFVSNPGNALDGNGRDPYPIDEGSNGDWHGTHTAGTIAAATNNHTGIAGINWVSKVLVVRVLGKDLYGYDSDILDGMRWAAGLPVPGTPPNRTPARVINMSMTVWEDCNPAWQSAIQDVRARGVTLVVAAGNDNRRVTTQNAPADCPGVVVVAAVDRDGSRASYSNYGNAITVAAPGTNTLSTFKNGSQDSYVTGWGTSMATPHVTGIVSLMLSVNPALAPDTIIHLLQQTARPYPPGANCNGICQTGIADAGRAVQAAAAATNPPSPARPAAQAAQIRIGRPQLARAGNRITLYSSVRLPANTRLKSFQWQQVGGPPVRLSNPHITRPAFIAPQRPCLLQFHLLATTTAGLVSGAYTWVRVR
jgi:serine protease